MNQQYFTPDQISQLTSGQVIGFNSREFVLPHPLILTTIDKFTFNTELKFDSDSLIFPYGNSQFLNLYPVGNMLGLWHPINNSPGLATPRFDLLNLDHSKGYLIDQLVVGKQGILDFLNSNNDGLQFYADLIRDGRLVLEKTHIEKIFEKLNLGLFSPNLPRFRRF
jgi:hypothetical protein